MWGAKVPIIPSQSLGKTALGGKRERAPVKGVKDSDVPARSSGMTHGGALKDTLGIGSGKREPATAMGVKGSDDPSTSLDRSLGDDAMDTSETPTGKCGRAPAEGLMYSDAPSPSVEKKCRLGDLLLAFASDKGVLKGPAKWWRSDMKERIDSQTRKYPGASSVMDDGRPVLFAWFAEECVRASGQEVAEAEERARARTLRERREFRK